MRKLICIIGLFIGVIMGCQDSKTEYPAFNEKGPFIYRFIEPEKIIIKLNDIIYIIDEDDINNGVISDEYPFNFKFRTNGNIDIFYDSKHYEIESPYKKLN